MAGGIERISRLSFLQQGLFLHSLLDPDAAYYVDQASYTLRGDLRIGALTAAWRQVVARHAMLRTSFHWEGLEEMVQVIHAETPLVVDHQDWRGVPAAEQAARLDEHCRELRRRRLDLERPPLLRLAVLRLDDDRHRLVFCYSHLLMDAWSALLVLNEVFARYGELARDREPRLEPPPRPYRDYVSWLRRQDVAGAEAFWRRALRGVTEPTPLPIRPLSAGPPAAAAATAGEYAQHAVELPDAVAVALHEHARAAGLTLSTVFQAAWALLLSRCAGREDVLFGSTQVTRPAELDGIEETVGLFVNTLPLPVTVRPGDAFLECCRAVQRRSAEIRRYDYSPLAMVRRCAGLPPDVPLFETIMTFLNVPGILQRWDGALEVTDGRYHYRTHYPLTVLVMPGQRLTLSIGYDTLRLDGTAIERLAGHLVTILATVAREPGTRVRDISLLTGAERATILGPWRGAAAPYPDRRLVHELIEASADRVPETPAIAFGGEELSYRDLDRRANRLAHHLRALGVRPEVRVAVCLPRSPDLVVSELAILKAGGVCVPLDVAHPRQRLEFLRSDASVAVIVSRGDVIDAVPTGGLPMVLLDADREAIAARPDGRPAAGTVPDGLSHVFYTSGSTGRPKGSMITHRGLCNLVQAQARIFGVGPGDRVLQWASASFDASLFDVLLALGAGATLQMATREETLPGPGLQRLLARARVTATFLTPSAAWTLDPDGLPDLRAVAIGGEVMSAELASRWRRGRRLWNLYGPTETSVITTYAECPEGGGTPPIGRPLPNVWVYVLERLGDPAPAGVTGEIHIGGVAPGRGYLGRPALTAERFVPDPFADGPGARMYRTGDLARWREDGSLEFVGRADGQVKVRGVRIETGEIEAVLEQHPAVRESVVRAAGDVAGRRLVAYVVGEEASDRPDEGELRGFLAARLPDHLVPAAFVVLPELPLNANGKVDSSALPSFEEAGPAPARRVSPRSEAEQAIADIWAGVLGVPEVGVDEDFYALGGDSIRATQVVARMSQRWEVELSPALVMVVHTVAGCVAALEEALAEKLAGLSDEETRRMLAELSADGGD